MQQDGDARALRPPGSRRIPGPVWDASAAARRLREEAELAARRAVEGACVEAERLRAAAIESGREEGLARATEVVARAALARERLLSGAQAQLVELALEVARRIVARAAEVDRSVVVELAARALAPVRGRAEVTIHAHPDDLEALGAAEPRLVQALSRARSITFLAEGGLAPGEVRVETEAGTVDARLAPQLEALGRALRGEGEDGW